ncbi:cilia- and flagella-associated protein 157-like [Scomber scombrus]|uniref:Cilia- and flagella-associated protein 157-like n=1 Tax=Scomber scombrus TaxID=13677 RepID=A0AAV1NK70_SCOSC
MADIISSAEREKSLYVKQIRHLDEQLESCQLKYDELEKQMKSLMSEFSTLEVDKKQVTMFLIQCKAAKERAEKMMAQLESQQKVAEQDIETLKMQQSQLMQELQEQISGLMSQSTMQVSKFEAEEKQLMSDMESQEQQHQPAINSLKEQHEAGTNSMKEKHEADFNSLKKEAESGRENFMEEAQKKADIFLRERISEINKKERAQHSKTLDQRELLLKENAALRREKYDLSEICSDVMTDLKKVKKENLGHENNAEQLRLENQHVRAKLKDCHNTHEVQEQALAGQETDMANERQHLTELYSQKSSQADQLGAELQRQRSRVRQLEIIIWEAIIIHKHIQMSENTTEIDFKMQRLLDILDSCSLQGTDSALNGATEKTVTGQGLWTGRRQTRTGDVGSGPRPRWKDKPTASRTAAAKSSRGLSAGNSAVTKLPVLLEPPPLTVEPHPFLLKWLKG